MRRCYLGGTYPGGERLVGVPLTQDGDSSEDIVEVGDEDAEGSEEGEGDEDG